MISIVRALTGLSLLSMSLLLAIASQDPPKSFGKPIALGEKVSVTVTKEKAEEWRSRYPTEFDGVKGTLASFTFRFSAKETEALSFATDYNDASRSDVRFVCGNRAFNTFTAARPKPDPSNPYKPSEKGESEFGRLGAFRGKDGREHSIFVGTDTSVTVFFDLPSECKGQKQVLSFTFKTDTEHANAIDVALSGQR